MHKPVYSRGTHDSTEEADLIELHDNLVPLFDAEGVDLVLSGHSHDYERSYLLRNDAILQADPADYSKTGSSDGTVYVVTGCAGQRGSGPLDHPFMARSYGQVIGFSVFDVGFDELRGRFLEVDGRTTDLFTIHKEEDALPPRATALEVRTKYELGLHFDEPVQPGSGPQGAEDASHYVLSPAGAVLSADLDSDGSTVVLHTSSLPPNRVYGLAVNGVADTSGYAASQRVPCVRSDDPSRVPRALVPRGHVWRYLEGIDDPPADWNAPSFDDASWGSGPAGFGYGYPDVATELDDMRGAALVLYLRTDFVVDDPREVSGLVLDVDYDDGFVAFLNGAEIARANVDPRQTSMTPAFRSHDAGSFEPFDASDLRALLVPGRNVLAVEGHNVTIDGRDFLLHPELVVTTDAPGGPPVAVLRTQVRTANAPARIRFSSAGSSDEDGPLASLRWDFGDGTPGVSGAEVEHLYERAGTFLATLVVQDGDGQEALAQQSIRIHEQGQAPLALLAVERTSIAPGEGVAFDGEASHDPDGGALTFHWDFGDPASGTDNVSSSATPAHAYARSGTFLATLVATDDEGSSATSEVAIEVHAPASTGGGGGCSVAPQRARGDPLLLAIPTLLVLVWMRRRLQAARGPTARAARGG
jgi:hypothetical protein